MPDPGGADAHQRQADDRGPEALHQGDQLGGVAAHGAEEALQAPFCPPHRAGGSQRHQRYSEMQSPRMVFERLHNHAPSFLSSPENKWTLPFFLLCVPNCMQAMTCKVMATGLAASAMRRDPQSGATFGQPKHPQGLPLSRP